LHIIRGECDGAASDLTVALDEMVVERDREINEFIVSSLNVNVFPIYFEISIIIVKIDSDY